jgi:site-specific DNA-cytosine methylase
MPVGRPQENKHPGKTRTCVMDKCDGLSLHPAPETDPIPVKDVIPLSLGTRSQRINPWIPSDRPAATVCKTDAGYELKEAEIKPTQQMYRVLTGQERSKHFGLVRVDPEKPSPTIPKSVGGSTTGIVHPWLLRRLTISEVKAVASFPVDFAFSGPFREKWARIGNSVPPLFMRAIAGHIRKTILTKIQPLEGPSKGRKQ